MIDLLSNTIFTLPHRCKRGFHLLKKEGKFSLAKLVLFSKIIIEIRTFLLLVEEPARQVWSDGEYVRQLAIAVNLRAPNKYFQKKYVVRTYYPNWDSISFFLIIFVFIMLKRRSVFSIYVTAFCYYKDNILEEKWLKNRHKIT